MAKKIIKKIVKPVKKVVPKQVVVQEEVVDEEVVEAPPTEEYEEIQASAEPAPAPVKKKAGQMAEGGEVQEYSWQFLLIKFPKEDGQGSNKGAGN